MNSTYIIHLVIERKDGSRLTGRVPAIFPNKREALKGLSQAQRQWRWGHYNTNCREKASTGFTAVKANPGPYEEKAFIGRFRGKDRARFAVIKNRQ